MYRLHHSRIMHDLPEILTDTDFTPFHYAFQTAVIMSPSTLPRIVDIGLLTKEEMNAEFIRNWLLGTGVNIFTTLASAMSLNTWKLDVLAGNIEPEHRMCELWNRRYEYEWVVPMTYEPEDVDAHKLFDVYSKNHVFGTEITFHHFTTIILQYQIFARLCELAGKYNPDNPSRPLLYKCDIGGNEAAADLIKEIMSYGTSKSWRELLDIISGTTGTRLSAKGLIDYFRPIYSLIRRTGESSSQYEESPWQSRNFCT